MRSYKTIIVAAFVLAAAVIAFMLDRPGKRAEAPVGRSDFTAGTTKDVPAVTSVSETVQYLQVIVQDQSGRPLPGAEIGSQVRAEDGSDDLTKFAQTNLTSAHGIAAVAWPANLQSLTITVTKHGFVPKVRVWDVGIGDTIPASYTARLEPEIRRVEVRGRVIDGEYRPVANAQVSAGLRYSRDRQETLSDAAGQFRFAKISEGEVPFAVVAEGFAPETRRHVVTSNGAELVFQLSAGTTIRGIVQDDTGKPLAGVRVGLDYDRGELAASLYRFSTMTDDDGRFEWVSAPNQAVPLYFNFRYHEPKRGVRVKPHEESIVTLMRNPVVHGLVLDANTGQPVKQFKVLPGSATNGMMTFFSPGFAEEFSSAEGRFSLPLREHRMGAIEVTADGYADALELLPKAENGGIAVTVRLRPSRALEGLVVNTDGEPVEGAKVGISQSEMGRFLHFVKRDLRANSFSGRGALVTSDAAGRFSIPSPPDSGTVVAVGSNGIASASVAAVRAGASLVVQQLGRIEGTLVSGGKPAPEQRVVVQMTSTGLGLDAHTYWDLTDGNGGFRFEEVPPGTVSIARRVEGFSGTVFYSHATDVTVLAGQTAKVTLGDRDGTVIGRVRFEDEPPVTERVVLAQLSLVVPPVREQVTSTERGRTNQRTTYATMVNADGELLIDSVAPGQYTLKMTASLLQEGVPPVWLDTETAVIVPVGAVPNQPIDVGELILRPESKKR